MEQEFKKYIEDLKIIRNNKKNGFDVIWLSLYYKKKYI